MPKNHKVNFDSLKKCRDDPAQRLRTPGCSVRDEKPFEPHSRTSSKATNVNDTSLNSLSLTVVTPEYTVVTQDTFVPQDEPVKFAVTQDKPVKFAASSDNNGATTMSMSMSMSSSFNVGNLRLPRPQPPREVTKFTEAMGAKGKLINVSYHLDAVIQDDIEESLIPSDDLEGRRYKERNYLNEEFTEAIMEKAGLSEWKIDPDLSTKQHLVLSKGNQTQIFFRGRAGNQDHIQGPEGLPRNKFENFLAEGDDRVGVDTRHVMDTLQNKPRDYGFIDELYENIKEKYPSNELEVISYSNGGPKGLHMSEKYNVKHTMMDGVLGPKEVSLLKGRTNASAALEMIRPANAPALASGMGLSGYQMMSGQTAPPNTKLTNIETYKISKMPLVNAAEAHDATHFSGQEPDFQDVIGERVHIGRTPGFVKSAAASFLPAIAATALVEGIAPDQNEHLKTGEIAALTGAGTQGLAPLLGAGGASTLEMALPLYASMEAATAASRAVDSVLPQDMNTQAKGTIEGTTGGAVGGLTFEGTLAAQSAIARSAPAIAGAARSAIFGASETVGAAAAETAGVEMAAMGGAELTGLAAAEAGLLTATEVTGALAASEAGLNPVLDAAFIATAFGAGIGGLIGLASSLMSGNHNEQELNDTRDAATERYLREEEEGQKKWAAYYQRSTEEAAVKNARSEMGRKKFGQKPADGIAGRSTFNYDPSLYIDIDIVTSNAREISRNTNLESEDSVDNVNDNVLLQSDAIDNDNDNDNVQFQGA